MVDELGPLVDGPDNDRRRQAALNLFETLPQAPGHLATVLAHEHEAQPQDHFAAAGAGRGAAADLVADADVADVPDPDGDAVMGGDDDVGDLLDARGQAHALDEVKLTPLDDVASADALVVGAQSAEDVVQGEVVAQQPVGLDDDLVLAALAAPRVDLGDARH